MCTFLKNTLLMLEGLLRTFSGDVARNDADVLAAIDRSFRRHGSDWSTASVAYSDTASLSFGLRSEPARRRQRSGPVPRQPLLDEGDETHAGDTIEPVVPFDPSEPWYIFVAKGISRIGRSLEHHLLGTRLLSYYSERCTTARPTVKGVAYLDAAFIHDDVAGQSKRRTTSFAERKRLYFGIPHRILRGVDPVLKEACRRVGQFYAQTFWSNQAAYMVCLAALSTGVPAASGFPS